MEERGAAKKKIWQKWDKKINESMKIWIQVFKKRPPLIGRLKKRPPLIGRPVPS